jgi:hypothetical protein
MNIRVGNNVRNIGESSLSKIIDPKYATVVGLVLSGFLPLDERVPQEVIWGEIPKSQLPPNPINGFETRNVGRYKEVEPTVPLEEPPQSGGLLSWLKRQVQTPKSDFGDDNGYL